MTVAGSAVAEISMDATVSLVDDDLRSAVAEALEDAGENWPQLSYAIENADSAERRYVAKMISDMPHIDRLEITGEILLEHVRFAGMERAGDLPDSIFYPYVMVYRISYEPIEAWRSYLLNQFSGRIDTPAPEEEKVRMLVASILGGFERTEWEFFGPMKGPISTLRSKSGTERELAVLVVAALRSFSIPARIARIAPVAGFSEGITWVEYYDSGTWHPAFLEEEGIYDGSFLESKEIPIPAVYTSSAFERSLVTNRYTSCGRIKICVNRGGVAVKEFESFSIAVPVDGELRPLDELQFGKETSTGEDGCVSLEVGKGEYVVQAGDRIESGDVLVFVEPVQVRAGETSMVSFDLPKGDAGD